MRTLIPTTVLAALLLLGGCRPHRHYQRVWARPELDTLVNQANSLQPDGGARKASIDDDIEGAKTSDEIFNEPVMDFPDPPKEHEMRKRNSKAEQEELEDYFGMH